MRFGRSIQAAVMLAALVGVPAFAQDGGGKMSAEEQAMMEAYAKAGTPGENHKLLETFVGNWSADMKMWMDPSKAPMESKATATTKSVLGGRFIQEEVSCDNMMGQPFQGMGLTGYDNVAKKFTATWSDTMGTCIMMLWGTYDASAKTITFTGDVVDPVMGKKQFKMITRLVSKDRHVNEFYDLGHDGKEFKSGEITYTRK